MTARKTVNIYDFDHTIYRGDASLDFIIYCLLRRPGLWRYLPVQALALARFAFGIWDRKRVKQAAFAFLRDLPDVDKILTAFWNKHEHKIKPWYVSRHKSNDIIVSASPEFILAPVAQKLAVRLLATRMDKRTGRITGQNCRGQEKLRRLQAYDSSLLINSCYSDSLSDRPLLELAKRPYLVKGDKIRPFQA